MQMTIFEVSELIDETVCLATHLASFLEREPENKISDLDWELAGLVAKFCEHLDSISPSRHLHCPYESEFMEANRSECVLCQYVATSWHEHAVIICSELREKFDFVYPRGGEMNIKLQELSGVDYENVQHRIASATWSLRRTILEKLSSPKEIFLLLKRLKGERSRLVFTASVSPEIIPITISRKSAILKFKKGGQAISNTTFDRLRKKYQWRQVKENGLYYFQKLHQDLTSENEGYIYVE